MVAFGRLFFRDFMNKLDLIVLFSILEIILDSVARGGGGENPIPIPLSVLRAFRILRLFKIVKSSKKLKVVLTSLAQSFESVNYLGMLLGLMILIFILLGMELFGGFYPRPELNYTQAMVPKAWEDNKLSWDGYWSRYHFDDFGSALLAIFYRHLGRELNETGVGLPQSNMGLRHEPGIMLPSPSHTLSYSLQSGIYYSTYLLLSF